MKLILFFYQRAIKYLFQLQQINIQISQVFLIFQSFLSYRSIRNSKIYTDRSVLIDSIFFVLCAYFDGSMVFFDEFLPQKSWNTVDIIQKQNINWFDTSLTVVIYYSYTNRSHEGFIECCVIAAFQFWVILRWMKEGWKSLSLGIPRHPKLLSKNEQPIKLGDVPEWHPHFLHNYRYFTRNYIFIRHMICVLLGASCMI